MKSARDRQVLALRVRETLIANPLAAVAPVSQDNKILARLFARVIKLFKFINFDILK